MQKEEQSIYMLLPKFIYMAVFSDEKISVTVLKSIMLASTPIDFGNNRCQEVTFPLSLMLKLYVNIQSHPLELEMRSRNLSSLQGIVIPPMG